METGQRGSSVAAVATAASAAGSRSICAVLLAAHTCSVTRLMASSELAAVSPTTSHQFSSLRPGKLQGQGQGK